MSSLEPRWEDGVPFCTEDCPSHDGKRCRLMGSRPDVICEPAVKWMAHELDVLRAMREKPFDFEGGETE